MGFLGGVLGAVAGSQKDTSDQTSGVHLNPNTAELNQAMQTQDSGFNQLLGMYNQGPGSTDINNAYSSNVNLAQMFQNYAQNGAIPTSDDIGRSNSLAQALFAPQQTALNQSFVQQGYGAQQQAAMLGRPVDDPILQAKLRTGFMNQQAQLNSQQGAFANQYAQQQPFQRLQFAQGGNNILNGLASQAFQNRAALLSMGNQIATNERNWQYQTSNKFGQVQSGGGLKGGIMGGMAGFGAMAGMSPSSLGQASGLSGMFGGGGMGSGVVTDMGAASAGGMGNAAGLALLA